MSPGTVWHCGTAHVMNSQYDATLRHATPRHSSLLVSHVRFLCDIPLARTTYTYSNLHSEEDHIYIYTRGTVAARKKSASVIHALILVERGFWDMEIMSEECCDFSRLMMKVTLCHRRDEPRRRATHQTCVK